MVFCWAKIGPVSISESILKIVTPVSVSLFSRVQGTGAAPRYFGSKEGWILIAPYFGESRVF